MAPKRRLGKSFTDLQAESNRISANQSLSQLIPTEELPGFVESVLPSFDMYGAPIVTEREEVGSFSGGSVDYSTQFVEDASPPKDNYGQGPSRSTRVAAHKFVPHERERESLMEKAGARGPTNTLGTVYVKFQRPGRMGQVWKYEHVPESIYDSFSNSTSKGRYINQQLNTFKKGPIGTRNDRARTQDFN
jgi:hypothetical protein